jgi:hypothetical protein
MRVAMHVLVRGTNGTQYHDQVRNLRGNRQHMLGVRTLFQQKKTES